MLRKLLRFLTGRLFISLVLIVVQLATLFLVLFYVQNMPYGSRFSPASPSS